MITAYYLDSLQLYFAMWLLCGLLAGHKYYTTKSALTSNRRIAHTILCILGGPIAIIYMINEDNR